MWLFDTRENCWFRQFKWLLCQPMVTLVASNLLTTKLSYLVSVKTNQDMDVNSYQNMFINSPQVGHIKKNSTNNAVEMCESNDFGCNRGLCWRTCTVEKHHDQDYSSWCFTAQEKGSKRFQHCKNNLDCSACWECSHPCVRKVS